MLCFKNPRKGLWGPWTGSHYKEKDLASRNVWTDAPASFQEGLGRILDLLCSYIVLNITYNIYLLFITHTLLHVIHISKTSRPSHLARCGTWRRCPTSAGVSTERDVAKGASVLPALIRFEESHQFEKWRTDLGGQETVLMLRGQDCTKWLIWLEIAGLLGF